MNNRSVSLWLATAIACATGGFLWTMSSSTKSSTASAPVAARTPAGVLEFAPGAPQLDMVRTQRVVMAPLSFGDSLSGRLALDEDATARLGAAVAGRIVAVKAGPGDRVRRGQVLAQIDAADFGAALADLEKARADERRKQQALTRAIELGAGEGVAGKDIEAARADAISAHAETVRAAQRIHNLNPVAMPVHGQIISLTSPLDGVVFERTASRSLEFVPGSSSPLFTVTDPSSLWLWVDLPESMASKVARGSKIDVESDAFPGEHFSARVLQPAQTVDPNTRRIALRARLDNPDRKLLPEMFVRCRLLDGGREALKVPNGALVNRGDDNFVFVQNAPGRFSRRRVQLLSRGGDSSYVSEGLASGEAVVATGAMLLDAELDSRTGGAQ